MTFHRKIVSVKIVRDRKWVADGWTPLFVNLFLLVIDNITFAFKFF